MVTAKQIRELLQAKPFKPFRNTLSDGRHFDVTHHEMAFVSQHTVEVGINTSLEDLPESVSR
jgi:hypothetical protein